MDHDLIYLILLVNLGASIFYYLKVKCEIPLFLALFNLLVQYRMISLELGYSDFVNFNYQIEFEFTIELAYTISELILLGTTVLMYAFMLVYRPKKKKFRDSNEYLKKFVLLHKKHIISGLIFFTFFQLVLSGNISEGYGNLSKLANSSFILLLYLVYISTDAKNLQTKLVYLLGLLAIGFITYSPSLRFQFLGWMIPLAYFIVRNIKPLPKLGYMAIGLVSILLIFSIAGVMRYNQLDNLSAEELYDESYDRLQVSDDVNFIDGFMMMYQVYPQYLDYTHGVEHLNILFRPIPRTLWANKPLAGWFQNYQEKYGLQQVHVGFSPTLYGVFYGEFAEMGIVFFSILWAFFLSWLYRTLSDFQSDFSWLLIGILLTALIPIFRSGDLAGDFAIVLMSYWPIIVFVYHYKKYVRKCNRAVAIIA